jgi:GNAT superfamily N-acetyltransferase
VRDSERIEIAALRDFLADAPPPAASRSAGEAIAVRFPGGPVELNRIVGLQSVDELDELEPLYDGASFLVSLDPETGLEPVLLERGYAAVYPWQKFEREPAPLQAETSLRVTDARRPEDFGLTATRGYGMPELLAPWLSGLVGRPGWHCFVAYDDEEPVGTGVLFEDGELGWVGIGATRPEHRSRGSQSAILAARVTRGAELGLRLLVTETGVPLEHGPGASYRNILRAGFRETYVRPNFARGEA